MYKAKYLPYWFLVNPKNTQNKQKDVFELYTLKAALRIYVLFHAIPTLKYQKFPKLMNFNVSF